MKISLKMLFHILLTISLVSCVSTSLVTSPAHAEEAPVSANIALATPATVSLGEPIMLHYVLANLSSTEKLVVLRGIYNTEWYTLSMKGVAGAQVNSIPDERPLDPPGFHSGDVEIYATTDNRDSRQEGYIVATKFLGVQRPGKYILTVHVQVAYALVTPSLENPVLMKNMIKSAGTTYVQDFNFPLTVTAVDHTTLQGKANALKKSIDKEQTSTLLLPEMDELFSMPEAQVGDVWEALALDADPKNRDLIADRLANLHSSKAADILFKMIDNSSSNSNFASRKLAEVYNEGSPALREHIRAVAAQKGTQLPEQIAVPQIID